MLSRQPAAMQLRYLQTLTQVAGDKSSTIVFPVPVDLLKSFIGEFSRPDGERPAVVPPTPPAAG